MNWKLTALVIGGYLGLSWLRKRNAITINKDDPAGKAVSDAADTGDRLTDVASQVKDAVTGGAPAAPGTPAAATPGAAPPAADPNAPSVEVLGTIF